MGKNNMQKKIHEHLVSLLFVILLVSIPFLSSQVAFANDDQGGGIVYGDDHAFIIEAPDGWVLDNQAGVQNGLHAVFYKKGSSWKDGTVVMYANTAHKSNKGSESLDALIKTDFDRFKSHSSDIRMIDAGKVKIGKKEAVIKKFVGDKWGNYETVAYIDESKIISILVMTSRNKKEFDDSYPSFIQLVKSYTFITEKVEFKKDK
jgi:hypothetical protein